MNVGVPAPRASKRGHERLVLEERPVLDGPVHAHEVLEEHPPGSDREVTDLGVAHLALREPDRGAGGGQLGVRISRPELVEYGRVGELDRVPRSRRSDAPAVQDDEGAERDRHAAACAPA